MQTTTMETLEFNKVKEKIADYAISDLGKKGIMAIMPSMNKKQIEAWLKESEEAKRILEISSSVPIHGLKGIEHILNNLHKGIALRAEQLSGLYEFLASIEKMKRFMKDKQYLAPVITSYVYSLSELDGLAEEIRRCIRNGKVDDYASKTLLSVRKQIGILEERMKNKVEHVLKSSKYQKFIQEQVVSIRNGRYVIPVKKEYRKNIKGTVLDASASGSTVYIEPAEMTSVQDEINVLKIQEEAEEQRILMVLTGHGRTKGSRIKNRQRNDHTVRCDLCKSEVQHSN